MTSNRIRLLLALVALGTPLGAATTAAPHANAEPLPANCANDPWGFLGLTQRRLICDGAIQPDGSWMRHRITGTPAHYQPSTTSCSGGRYYTNCSSYPGGWVDTQVTDDEVYPVTPDSVPGGEPGHLPFAAPQSGTGSLA